MGKNGQYGKHIIPFLLGQYWKINVEDEMLLMPFGEFRISKGKDKWLCNFNGFVVAVDSKEKALFLLEAVEKGQTEFDFTKLFHSELTEQVLQIDILIKE